MNLRKEVKCILVLFCLVFVVKPQTASSQEVFSSYIILNDQPLDNPAWVEYFEGDNEPKSLVHTSEIIDSMKEIFSGDVYEKIKSKLDSENRISFKSLNEIGIKTNMDLQSLNLGLTVDVKDKKLTEVFVSNQRKKKDIKDLKTPDPFSGFFNIRGTADFLGDNLTNNTYNYNISTTTSLEAVLNFKGLIFETQYIRNENELNSSVELRRSFTRFIYDDQERAVRYTLGDLVETSRGFQEINFGIGANFRKELTIKPNLFRSSFKRHKFFLETNSKVEIFINGRLAKKLYLNQGPVELSDFPFISGENDVRIQVTDVFGNIKNLNYADINDSRILPKGFSDYSFTLLFPRRSTDTLGVEFDDETYDYDDVNLNGYYSYGAFVDGVLGFDWQISNNRYLIGTEALYAQKEGIAKLNLAQSGNSDLDLDGFALRFEYENLLFKDGSISDFRLISGFEYKTRGFTRVSSIGENPTEYIATVSVGQNFQNSVRGSLGFSKEWGFDQGFNRNFLTSNFGWTFLKNFDFSANIRFNLDDTDDSTVLFSLNWYAPTNDQQSTTTYDPINETINSEFVSFPIKNRQNFRTYVGGEVNDTSERALFGLDYFNQRAEYRLAHSSAFLNTRGQTQSTQISFGTGFAFTNRGFSITRPIDDAFVLVGMPNRPKGYSVPIGRGVDSQRGEINRFGPASITNLAPYFTDRINLDIAQLPYGYILDKEVFSFHPSYRSGIYIRVGVGGEVSLNGSAVFAEDSSPAAYLTGNVYSVVDGKMGENIGQFFNGGDGSFSVEGLKKNDYILVFQSADVSYEPIFIKVDKAIGVQEIKDVIKLQEVEGGN